MEPKWFKYEAATNLSPFSSPSDTTLPQVIHHYLSYLFRWGWAMDNSSLGLGLFCFVCCSSSTQPLILSRTSVRLHQYSEDRAALGFFSPPPLSQQSSAARLILRFHSSSATHQTWLETVSKLRFMCSVSLNWGLFPFTSCTIRLHVYTTGSSFSGIKRSSFLVLKRFFDSVVLRQTVFQRLLISKCFHILLFSRCVVFLNGWKHPFAFFGKWSPFPDY